MLRWAYVALIVMVIAGCAQPATEDHAPPAAVGNVQATPAAVDKGSSTVPGVEPLPAVLSVLAVQVVEGSSCSFRNGPCHLIQLRACNNHAVAHFGGQPSFRLEDGSIIAKWPQLRSMGWNDYPYGHTCTESTFALLLTQGASHVVAVRWKDLRDESPVEVGVPAYDDAPLHGSGRGDYRLQVVQAQWANRDCTLPKGKDDLFVCHRFTVHVEVPPTSPPFVSNAFDWFVKMEAWPGSAEVGAQSGPFVVSPGSAADLVITRDFSNVTEEYATPLDLLGYAGGGEFRHFRIPTYGQRVPFDPSHDWSDDLLVIDRPVGGLDAPTSVPLGVSWRDGKPMDGYWKSIGPDNMTNGAIHSAAYEMSAPLPGLYRVEVIAKHPTLNFQTKTFDVGISGKAWNATVTCAQVDLTGRCPAQTARVPTGTRKATFSAHADIDAASAVDAALVVKGPNGVDLRFTGPGPTWSLALDAPEDVGSWQVRLEGTPLTGTEVTYELDVEIVA